MKTMPTRISGDLFAAAKAAGEIQSRSAAQQLDHWARLGRALESSPVVTHSFVERVLSGQLPYDAVSELEQATVRAAWDEKISERLTDLNFEDHMIEVGSPWAESDPEGQVLIRNAESTPK